MASDCPEPEVCRRCRKEGHVKDDCPEPEKCFNCRQEGHSSADCPEPELCRNCRKEGHVKDDCPQPDKCFNCREEGHTTADCPEPEKCRRCRKEGHQVADCPDPMRCGEDGEEKEMYVPKGDVDAEELFGQGIASGINFAKYDDIPVEVTGDNKPSPIRSFGSAGLRPILVENITKSGYKVPTPVQKYGIPIIMAGRDVMACAQTGSGKTAAFLLPIIHKLIEGGAECGAGDSAASPQCVVITPTRELAIQIHNEARKFAQGSMVKSVVAYGGTSVFYQAGQLQRGCNIRVATPGRLLDFVEKGRVSFANCKYLVLDEADRMLDMGFMPEIEKMVEDPNMPKKAPEGDRQTLMFSATFPDEVQESAQEFLNDYLFLTIGLVGGACSDVRQEFHEVARNEKRDKLEELMQDPDRDPKERTLIFVQTKKNADFLATYLSGEGLPTTSIHGDRLQREREEALFDFRTGDKPILVATAVAARGLDIPNVAHVINYDMPDDVDEYVHRIGRTGRVGNLGKATSFVDPGGDGDVMPKLVDMLTKVGVEVPEFLGEGGAGGDGGGDDDEDWG